jgi:succinate dehydrogenase/fumarate reductase flavoprotein subunit
MASLIAARSAMQQAMSLGAGIVRDRSGLQATYAALDGALATAYAMNPYDPSAIEVVNLATVGSALVSSALCREESRGAHSRSDYPQTNDEVFRCRLAIISHAPARSAVPHKVDPS